ncbi:MAG: lytic murein transglycosylase B [Legionella sp.]|nr:lytic murein transglycosylase B [Legionella sp.]
MSFISLRWLKLNVVRCVCSLFILGSHLVFADAALLKRKDVKAFINEMVTEHAFHRPTIVKALNEAKWQSSIVEAMDKPYEKKAWNIYKEMFLTAERLQEGLAFWSANQAILKKAEEKYGVPASLIVAVLGVETRYGKNQGHYRVLDALVTLAFNYPKRSAYFTKELKEYFLLCREHQISPTEYVGSYAGAMGQPQFMPSSYRYYAADFLGKTKKDLMQDTEAVIASVANYFQQHGWQNQGLVAQPAKVAGERYKKTIDTTLKRASYDVSQLKAAGIVPEEATMTESITAGLIALMTQKGEEFWLAYPNFYVITRYNSSPQYALAVYLLSQQLNQHKRIG